MIAKKLFAFISCAALFVSTFSASLAVAQIFDEEKTAAYDSFFPSGIAGAWQFNSAESDRVLTVIGKLLDDRKAAATAEKSDRRQSGQPVVSISIFAPDAMILSSGDAGELTINEIFKSVIETRTVIVDGTLREYEIAPKAKVAVTATGKAEGFTVVTVSPRGSVMTESFRLASGGAKLIVVVSIEHSGTNEVLKLRRVYDRAAPDTSFRRTLLLRKSAFKRWQTNLLPVKTNFLRAETTFYN